MVSRCTNVGCNSVEHTRGMLQSVQYAFDRSNYLRVRNSVKSMGGAIDPPGSGITWARHDDPAARAAPAEARNLAYTIYFVCIYLIPV